MAQPQYKVCLSCTRYPTGCVGCPNSYCTSCGSRWMFVLLDMVLCGECGMRYTDGEGGIPASDPLVDFGNQLVN